MRSLLIVAVFGLALASSTLAQPAGYDFVRHRGKLIRHPIAGLPWRVYVNDHRYYEATLHALRTWNAAGHRQGYPDLFAPVDNLVDADMLLDWTGKGLPSDKAGGVYWNFQGEMPRISRLVMDPYHQIPEGNRAQILLQELGHTLGLGDSSHPQDIMYPIMHTRRYRRVNEAQLTSRDLAAFRWLYAQDTFLPITSDNRVDTQSTPLITMQPTGQLEFDPIKVELKNSVNVRIALRNPQTETLRAPLVIELWGRPRGQGQWRQLKTWNGLDKIPAGYRITRDYFTEMQPLFASPFELMVQVHRSDNSEVLAETTY